MSNNIEVVSAVHGIAPRSDELLKLGADFRRGRVNQDVFDERINEETEAWQQLQIDAGIDLCGDGQLRWQDHLRPIAKATIGFADDVDEASVTPWFEDNRFYRQPTVLEELQLDANRFEELAGTPGECVSLIGPLTFATLVASKLSSGETAATVGDLYVQLLEYYASKGVKQIILEDYERGYPAGFEKLWHQSFVQVANALELDVIKVPVEVTQAEVKSFLGPWTSRKSTADGGWEVTTIVKAIDGSNTAQDKSLNAVFFDYGGRYILTHTVDLEKVPLKSAQEKIKLLGEFTAKLRAEAEERS